MSTLIYAPSIKCHVMNSQGKVIDLSEDLVSWTLVLRENATHTFSFKLANAQRKYERNGPAFLPMDRITVALKRINWLHAFTGYLNSSPIFQAWPGTLDLSATCTLKVAAFRYWDPTCNESFQMMQNALATDDKGQGPRNDTTEGDKGLSNLINVSMQQVLGWDKKRIHIGKVPNTWSKWAGAIGDEVSKEIAMYKDLGPGSAGSGEAGINVPGIAVNIPPGNYGGNHYNATQMKWASYIYSTINNTMKLANRNDVKTCALMTALVESGLKMYANANNPASLKIPHDAVGSDHGSVGLFQQQVGGAANSTANWGTTPELMDAVTSTEKFVKPLLKVIKSPIAQSGGNAAVYGGYCQSVQGSQFPDRYSAQFKYAAAMVAAGNKLAASGASTSSSTATTGTTGAGAGAGSATSAEGRTATTTAPATSASPARSTGTMLAAVAANLITSHAKSKKWIRYNMGGDDPDHTALEDVKVLDCSSLVDWVYYHATAGQHLAGKGGGRTNVAAEIGLCKRISIDLAIRTQGAVLLEGPNGHVGMSLGNGQHVAAHTDGIALPKQVDISPSIGGGGWTQGGLLPHIDYSGAGTTQSAANQLKSIMNYPSVTIAPNLAGITPIEDTGASATPDTDPTGINAYAAIVNSLYFMPDVSGSATSNALGGPVMLLNDTPFLPWLQQVCASSMRSFCSAPNGDFIAWFPDYFGIWQSSAILNVEPIELQNFAVYWSDSNIVTHQFVIGSSGNSAFDPASGQLSATNGAAGLISLAQQTSGIATMDYPEIFKVIYGDMGKAADAKFIQAYLQRFGARPAVDTVNNVQKNKPAFYWALYLFMQRWANQFTAMVPTTFMPEAFPGMLLQIQEYGFQAYINQVTHTAVYGQGGAFQTQISISAPSTIGSKGRNSALAWMPEGGAI